MNAKQAILNRLASSPLALAVHELALVGYSENNLATRLSELQAAGKVIGTRRPGKQFKEWTLSEKFCDSHCDGAPDGGHVQECPRPTSEYGRWMLGARR